VIAATIVIAALAVAVGGSIVAVRLLDRPEPTAHAPDDLCDRVDPAPLRRVQLVERVYSRTLRQTVTDDGLVTDTCQLSMEMADVAPPSDPSVARADGATLSVHVTHHPDAAAAARDFERSRHVAGGSAEDVTGLSDQAYINFDNDEYASGGYEEVELNAQRGTRQLVLLVYAMRTSDWEREPIRTALADVARRVLEA
jgi:hypothetical protein